MKPAAEVTASPNIASLVRAFRTHLEAGLKSPETIASYLKAVSLMQEFFEAQGIPTAITSVSREHIELFIADLAHRTSPATVVNRFKGIRAFWRWMEDEGEVRENPMRRIGWPKLVEAPPTACSQEDVRKLLRVCDRQSFKGRRDAALIAVMIDTGWRVNEVLSMTVTMGESADRITVMGKGKKTLIARLSPAVQKLVDRYLRVRNSNRRELWLSSWGRPMTRNGVWEALERRSRQAGISHIKPHALRHSQAIWWLSAGGNIMDLKENMGHSALRTTEKYLRYQAQDRALEARKVFAPGNLLE